RRGRQFRFLLSSERPPGGDPGRADSGPGPLAGPLEGHETLLPSRRSGARGWSRAVIGWRGGVGLMALLSALTVLFLAWAWARGGRGRPAAPTSDGPGPLASAHDWVRFGFAELRRYRLGSAREALARAKRDDPTLAAARQGLIWIHSVRRERAEALAEFAAL